MRYVVLVFSLIGLLVVVTDQVTKSWVRANIPYGTSIPPSGFFQITHTRNTGAVFGILPDYSAFLSVAAVLGAIFIVVLALNTRHLPYLDNNTARSALGLIFGGTLGNLVDRLRFGYVTDFISVGIWPSFNVADSAVSVGTAVFAYFILKWAIAEKSSGGRDVPSDG